MRSSLFLKAGVVFTFLVIAFGALTAKSKDSRVSTPSASSSQPVPPSEAFQEQADQDVQGLVIAIRPTGFVPSEIELTSGTYLFVVQNRCGIRDLTLRLDRDTGERLVEVHDQRSQWKKAFNLNPGTYVLSVVDHPKWRCVITVKPR